MENQNLFFDRLICSIEKLNNHPNKQLIPLDLYCEIYEIFKDVVKAFGKILYFAYTDINNKINILKNHMNCKNQINYKYVADMIEYELNNGILESKNSYYSGTRNYIILHRAYEFLNMFIYQLFTKQETSSNILKECYDATISKHHHWIVRKAVHVAANFIPHKDSIIKTLLDGQDYQCDQVKLQIEFVLKNLQDIKLIGDVFIPDQYKNIV